MNREEAIKILEGLAVPVCAEAAFDMAIEALKQPEVIRCKDCKLFGRPRCLMKWWSDPDGYCHGAKRREEGGNE